MSNTRRILVVALLACAVGAVLLARQRPTEADAEAVAPDVPVAASKEVVVPAVEDPELEPLPRLVDLGAGKCIPCKMMEPILEELDQEYADTFAVEFIDVWENPHAGEPYAVRIIPTQIFYDAKGRELFRHEGFFGKEEILAKWQEYGVAAVTKAEE